MKKIPLFLALSTFTFFNFNCANLIQKNNTYSQLVHSVNEKSNVPNLHVQLMINKCKNKVSDEIIRSNLPNETKSKIIDSISSLKFIVSNSISLTKNKDQIYFAFYFYNEKNSIFRRKLKYNEFINLNYKLVNSDNFEYTIYHELYHFIDRLLGSNNDKYYSDEVNFKNYLDYKLVNESYTKAKISSIIYFKNIDKNHNIIINNEQILLVNYILKDISSLASYATSNQEMFVRYIQMKRKMVELGVIDNINDKINKSDIGHFLSKFEFYNSYNISIPDYFYFMVFFDFSKIDDLEKQIKL